MVEVDSGINAAVRQVRRALCDSGTHPRYIETVPRKGYRFIAPVSAASDDTEARHHARIGASGLHEESTALRVRARAALVVVALLCLVATVAFWPEAGDPADAQGPSRAAPWGAEARENLLIARHMLQERRDREAAIELLERVLEAEPTMAPAWATLASALRGSGDAALGRQRQAIRRALELDPALAEAHEAHAIMSLFDDWEFERAEASFVRAISLDPDRTSAHHNLAMLYAFQRRFDKALHHVERARNIDPVSIALHADGGHIYYLAGQYAEAERMCSRAAALGANPAGVAQCLYDIYIETGRAEDAAEQMRKILEARNAPSELLIQLESPVVEPRKKLRLAHTWNLGFLESISASPVAIADCQLALGLVDAAFDNIEAALAQRSYDVFAVAAHPRARPYLDHPRLRRMIDQIGLVQASNRSRSKSSRG